MHPWHASVSLVAIMLLATSNGERLGMEERAEPDSSEGLSQLEREGGRGRRGEGVGRERGGRGEGGSIPSFEFTFDVGCQELTKLEEDWRVWRPWVRGSEYTGSANMTVDGKPCVAWADAAAGDAEFLNDETHNNCRNPLFSNNGIDGVWCYTSTQPHSYEWGVCPVPRCTQPILNLPVA